MRQDSKGARLKRLGSGPLDDALVDERINDQPGTLVERVDKHLVGILCGGNLVVRGGPTMKSPISRAKVLANPFSL